MTRPVKVFIQRSSDGQILYFRKSPNTRWEMRVDPINGSHYLFDDLRPGEGHFFEIRHVPSKPSSRSKRVCGKRPVFSSPL